MRLAGRAAHRDPVDSQQRLGLRGVRHHPFGAQHRVGMFGKLFCQAVYPVSHIADAFPVGKGAEQIQRSGGKVQRALTPTDDDAAQAELIKR